MEILVVDDEPAICSVVRLVLSMEGYAVITCDNGEEALEWLAEREPAVALIDLSLRNARGLTVVEAARALRPHLPIIVITGMLPDGLKNWSDCSDLVHVAGTYGLGKPFKPKELCRLVALAASLRLPELDIRKSVGAGEGSLRNFG